MKIYDAVESIQNMKFPGFGSNVDEEGRSAEDKAKEGAAAFLLKATSRLTFLPFSDEKQANWNYVLKKKNKLPVMALLACMRHL